MRRWLLLLGSNLPDDLRVREALVALRTLGPCTALGPVRRLRPVGGGKGWYYNVVATLEHPGGQALREALGAIQLRLGRNAETPEQVDIDIDIVACAGEDGRWIIDAHAASKPEMFEGPLGQLFDEAGVLLHTPEENA